MNTSKKNLILVNLKELYFEFLKLGQPIGFSKFCQLRPKCCITVDSSSGVHSVYVCEIHQNCKLMAAALPSQVHYKMLQEKMACDGAGSKCRCQVCRFQVPGIRCAGLRYQVCRYQVCRFQVPGAQVLGVRCQVSSAQVSGFRSQVLGTNFKIPEICKLLKLLELISNNPLTNICFIYIKDQYQISLSMLEITIPTSANKYFWLLDNIT